MSPFFLDMAIPGGCGCFIIRFTLVHHVVHSAVLWPSSQRLGIFWLCDNNAPSETLFTFQSADWAEGSKVVAWSRLTFPGATGSQLSYI